MVEVELFGALQRLATTRRLSVAIATPCSVQELREALRRMLDTQSLGGRAGLLLESCVCATGERVLRNDEEISGLERISFLPPVCGG